MQERSKPPAKAQIPIETGNIPESIPYLTDPTLRSSNEHARLAWKIILSLPQPTAVWPHTRSILISKTTDESPNDNTRSISDHNTYQQDRPTRLGRKTRLKILRLAKIQNFLQNQKIMQSQNSRCFNPIFRIFNCLHRISRFQPRTSEQCTHRLNMLTILPTKT